VAIALPNFILTADVCMDDGGVPGASRGLCNANLAYGERSLIGYLPGPSQSLADCKVLAQVLFPVGVDVRDDSGGEAPDWVNLPAFTQRWYRVLYVDLAGAGFPNEHLVCLCYKQLRWEFPLVGFWDGGSGGSPLQHDHRFWVDYPVQKGYVPPHGRTQDASQSGPNILSPVLFRPSGSGNLSRPLGIDHPPGLSGR
jgi:hypothetical protein